MLPSVQKFIDKHNGSSGVVLTGEEQQKIIDEGHVKIKSMIVDALIENGAREILSMDYDKLLNVWVKLLPQKVETKGVIIHTFAEMIKKQTQARDVVRSTVVPAEVIDV